MPLRIISNNLTRSVRRWFSLTKCHGLTLRNLILWLRLSRSGMVGLHAEAIYIERNGTQNVTYYVYYVTQWNLKIASCKLQSGNGIWRNSVHIMPIFVQSTSSQPAHFHSKILWTYDQAPLDVRPGILWSYVHGKTPREIWDFMPVKRCFWVFENCVFTQKGITGCVFFAFSVVIAKSKRKESLRNATIMSAVALRAPI